MGVVLTRGAQLFLALPKIEQPAGPRTATVMRDATKVRLFRVASPFSSRDFQTLVKTHPTKFGYPILGEVAVDTTVGRELGAILADPRTYVPPERRSTCLFDPGYILAFEQAGQSVHVIICFNCGDIAIRGAR